MRRDRHSVNVEGTFWAAEDALRPCQEELVVRIPSRAEIFERVYAIIGEKVILIVFFSFVVISLFSLVLHSAQ